MWIYLFLNMKFLSSFLKYNQIFKSPIDIMNYRKLQSKKATHVLKLFPRESPFSLYCRPNTTDAQVLFDVFSRKNHLPPTKLPSNSTIVDLGCNVGFTMAHFSYFYPHSKIYGVEMDKKNFLMAQKNLDPISNQCILDNSAIWYKNEIVEYSGDREWGYKIEQHHSKINFNKIKSKTIDRLFDEYEIKHCNYLKMDIEGAEEKILENMGDWINKIDSMKIELHPPISFEFCKNMLDKFNFKIYSDNSITNTLIALKLN